MAFDLEIVAIQWLAGRHFVVAENIFNSDLKSAELKAAFPLHDVSENSAYIDEATILSRTQLLSFVNSDRLQAWLDNEAKDGTFFLIHRAEWESGLGD